MKLRSTRNGNQGFTLLWLLPLLVAMSTFVSGGWLFIRPTKQQPASHTEIALKNAKQALLGYAASYPEIRQKDTNNRLAYVYGHLPCPSLDNTNNAGQEATQCGLQGVSVLGRLPWSTLGLALPKDSDGECLWYAVSGNYKANPKADLLNPDVPGQFTIQAQGSHGLITLAKDVVAVIIAPGKPLAGQQRLLNDKNLCTSALSPENFLDSFSQGNNALLSSVPEEVSYLLQTASDNGQPNDRMIWITRQELFKAIEHRQLFKTGKAFFDLQYLTTPSGNTPALAQRVADCLREFALTGSNIPNAQFGRLPWAAPLALTSAAPNTFKNDRFNDKKDLLAGRIPMLIWDSKQAMSPASFLGTLNLCASSTDTDCRLFRTNNCPNLLPIAGYPAPYDGTTHKDSPDGWLEKWKDHLFYAVAPAYQPKTGSNYADTCQASNCLNVNNRPYAAVIIYAGPALAGQSRLSSSDKQNITNYLEGINASSIAGNGRIFSTTGNDQLVCLRPNLTLSVGCND